MNIQLPDGRTIAVETDEPKEAARAARRFLAKEWAEADDYDPTSGMSGLDLFLSGAGKSVVDTGRGLKQIGAEIGNAVGLVDDETVNELYEEQTAVNERDAALMSNGSAVAGNVAGTLATTMLPAGVAAKGAQALNMGRTAAAMSSFVNPNNLVKASAVGGILGASRPIAEGESRAENAAFGAATGAVSNGAVKGAGLAAEPVKNALSKTGQESVRLLQKAGVPLDTAQKTGSRFMERVSAFADDNPIVTSTVARYRDKQQSAFNRAVLRTIGEDADAATPSVLDAAAKRIGAVFSDVAKKNPIKIDGRLNSQLTIFKQQAARRLGDDAKKVTQYIDDIYKAGRSNPKDPQRGYEAFTGRRRYFSGDVYQNIKTELDSLSMGGDQSVGRMARQLREMLDDSLERSAGKAEKARIVDARQQWKRLLQIKDAVRRNEEGNIVPTRLFNAVSTKKNDVQALMGKGDQELIDLARAGKSVLKSKTPNSGTAARTAMQLAPAAGLGATAAVVGEGTLEERMARGAMAAGVGYAAPQLAVKSLTNPGLSRYLTNGVANTTARKMLTAPANSAATGSILRHLPVATVVAPE